MMMTEEQKNNTKKLIAALRSGEYKQTRKALRIGDRFCCLGVAENIRGCKWIPVTNGFAADNRDKTGTLTEDSLKFYGFRTESGDFVHTINTPHYDKIIYPSLWVLNDKGFTFDEIADIIEWAVENNDVSKMFV
jgi:hypothetical protein